VSGREPRDAAADDGDPAAAANPDASRITSASAAMNSG
jgi:hypothetical protein